jgi:hypothetical protein
MARFPMTAPEAFLPADLRGDDASNVMDNLAASATPIAVEPTARKKRDLRQEQIDRLVAAGDDPQTAAMVVDRLREMNGGEIPAGLFDSYNTPEGNAALAKRIADGKVANARMDAFERNYNAETGHPEYGYDENGNAAKLGRVNINNPSAVERSGKQARAYNFNAPYNSEMESLNNPMSDERRAQIAADFDAAIAAKEAKWARGEEDRLAQNKAEVEKYGTGNDRQITKEQAAARYERKVAEDKMRQNPAVVEARLKRMAAAAGISMSEARASYEAGMEENGGGQTFDEFRRGTQDLRDKATDRRLAAQQAAKDNWRATAMLAGGSQNINSGNRGIYNQAAAIEDPAKRAEFLSQFRQTPGNFESNDPRIQVAQIQAQAAKDNAAAERESRTSQNQWLETTRIAAEERARKAQRFDVEQRQKFDAEQKHLDRELQASQGNAAREADAEARQKDLDLRIEQHKERMQQEANRMQAETNRHEQQMEAMRLERQANRDAVASGDKRHAETVGVERDKLTAETNARLKAQEELKREQEMAPLVAQYGEGVRHLATGDYSTPQAQDSLQKLAKQSDESWFGFGHSDAVRMDAILQRLGVSDADARHQMIERFGYEPSNNFLGMGGEGRGERLSYWFSGRPW